VTRGASNELFEVRRGAAVWILRRPPRTPHSPEQTNRIILREFRILTALDHTSVPHPAPAAVCDDPSVIGANFYLMERIDGFTPADPLPPPFDRDVQVRRDLGNQMVDVLAELGNADWRALGLESYGKPANFLERQVDRWLGQLASYKIRDIPGLDAVATWLTEQRPADSPAGILHGDYHVLNVLFHYATPARMAAVVDWEQSTIGDPLLDLGWLLAGWAGSGESPRFMSEHLAPHDGLPTRDQLIERYARRSGRNVGGINYYVVLSWFKLACVLEGHYVRYVTGKSTSEQHRDFGDLVLRLVGEAEESVRTTH
jgi:aminoglycoside phosphotransferase (APT) family kinase protein